MRGDQCVAAETQTFWLGGGLKKVADHCHSALFPIKFYEAFLVLQTRSNELVFSLDDNYLCQHSRWSCMLGLGTWQWKKWQTTYNYSSWHIYCDHLSPRSEIIPQKTRSINKEHIYRSENKLHRLLSPKSFCMPQYLKIYLLHWHGPIKVQIFLQVHFPSAVFIRSQVVILASIQTHVSTSH